GKVGTKTAADLFRPARKVGQSPSARPAPAAISRSARTCSAKAFLPLAVSDREVRVRRPTGNLPTLTYSAFSSTEICLDRAESLISTVSRMKRNSAWSDADSAATMEKRTGGGITPSSRLRGWLTGHSCSGAGRQGRRSVRAVRWPPRPGSTGRVFHEVQPADQEPQGVAHGPTEDHRRVQPYEVTRSDRPGVGPHDQSHD